MASVVEICNRALQKLGAKRITTLTEDSVSSRACNAVYNSIRLAELRSHPWSCAIKRASLAASTTEPEFNKGYAYPLPSDFVRLIENDNGYNYNDNDWQIEGTQIITDDSAPLYIRYIYDLSDPAVMDAMLREVISCRMAIELCEELTQSNTKKTELKDDYRLLVREARKVNAISGKPPTESPDDVWITVRR